MRSGPKAIHYQGSLFRASELVWVKCCPLPPYRLAIKYALMALGIGFFVVVGMAKGTYVNVEGILGFLCLHIGYCMTGETRLASSGDLEESYDGRGGSGERATFEQWVTALQEGPDECKLGKPNAGYYYWINLQRVAWARHARRMDLYGLTALPLYLGYAWLAGKNFKIPLTPLLQGIRFLEFDNLGMVTLCSYACAALGLAAALTSISNVVEVRATGGLSDTFTMSLADSQRFLDKLAGNIEQGTKGAATTPAAVPAMPEPPARSNSTTPEPPVRTVPAPAPIAAQPTDEPVTAAPES